MRRTDFERWLAGTSAALPVAVIVAFALHHTIPCPISADEFIRAMGAQHTFLIDRYFGEHLDPNVRGANDRSLLLAATLLQDRETVGKLLDAGATPDLADTAGLTPLMVAAMYGDVDLIRTFAGHVTNIAARDRQGRSALHCAIAAKNLEAVELLLSLTPNLVLAYDGAQDILVSAINTGNVKIFDAVLTRLPRLQDWSPVTQRALASALRAGDRDQIRLLLSKHVAPPTAEGKSVPLLAYAIVADDSPLFSTLLSCGADPNTTLPPKYDKEFLDGLPSKSFRNYIEDDRNVNVLMLAAGLGRTEYVRTLLQAGADRNRATWRYKMVPLYFSAELGHWQASQVLLGSGPPPEHLRIEISLASQHVSLIKDGVPILNSVCSTGRSGYSTRRGDYVITDKERNHRSTIYKVDMPYFMRLSCLDFGMHEGVVPNYPASHGCIRLPSETARRLFAEIPIGTLVSVQ
jgi:ankyrin repeat protein